MTPKRLLDLPKIMAPCPACGHRTATARATGSRPISGRKLELVDGATVTTPARIKPAKATISCTKCHAHLTITKQDASPEMVLAAALEVWTRSHAHDEGAEQ